MRHNRLKIISVLMLGLGYIGLHAQNSINTAGGIASGSGGQVSYSVGQVAYQTLTNTNGSVIEGVQQPYEISVVTAIEKAPLINLSVSAYPNPVNDFLELKVESRMFSGEKLKDLCYQLFDTKGKLLLTEKITCNPTTIGMANLVPATYLLKIVQKKQEIKTFKITKK